MRFPNSVRSALYIAVLCIIVIILSGRGITDEGVVSLNGDMPRYIMNGVYFYDFVRDLPIAHPLQHAYQYFARYPALSLGHHPLLLGFAEVPFFAIFGITILASRLTIIFFMLLAAVAWFLLIRSVYDGEVAFLSSLLFVTTPFIMEYSRLVMSEIPTLALIITAAYFFYHYCASDRKNYAYASAIILSFSLYTKQIAVFMIPVFLCYLLIIKGPKKLISKEVIISCIIITILITPLIAITLKYSQTNVSAVEIPHYSKFVSSKNLFHLNAIWKYQLTLPVAILSLISLIVSILQRERRAFMFIIWILSCYLLVIYLGITRTRDTIYWVPVFCLFAAASVNFFQYRIWKIIVSSIIILITGYQFVYAYQAQLDHAYGYEEAARYIVEHRKGDSILYSGVEDTGYFIFFVRKYDPKKEMIVLRADKLLATSKMSIIIDERIDRREEIYDILKRFGVGYVVIEDMESRSQSQSLEWLREEVKSDRFILRKEITLRSNNQKIDKVPLVIYEFKEYSPPRKGQMLRMDIPLMGDSIELPFEDLLPAR